MRDAAIPAIVAAFGKGAYFSAALPGAAQLGSLENAAVWFADKKQQRGLGQIPRLLVGGIKSFVGKIPVGNTGGANVPPLLPMEIPADLQQMINSIKRSKAF